MAQYEHLPIYKKAMDFVIYTENIVKNFSKYNKYTLGSELRNIARKIVVLIINANSSKEKYERLIHIRETISELKVIIRICKEVKAFNNIKSFTHAIEEVISISKQIEGWIKSVKA